MPEFILSIIVIIILIYLFIKIFQKDEDNYFKEEVVTLMAEKPKACPKCKKAKFLIPSRHKNTRNKSSPFIYWYCSYCEENTCATEKD